MDMAVSHYSNFLPPNTIFELPDAQRFAGTWIVAPPGRGKTNLLHNLVAQDLTQRCTIVMMDSKGDLINAYKGYGDVVVVDPATANINPLQLGSSTRSVEFLEYIFTAQQTNVPFNELLDSGKTVIIDNSKDDLGEEGAEFFGRFFVALIWMAAVSRSRLRPEQKMPVYVYIDECHTVIKRDDKIATILDECRSQKIALILAHQRVTQITSPNVLD